MNQDLYILNKLSYVYKLEILCIYFCVVVILLVCGFACLCI